nr:hypothetical protein [Petrachloros mirabilis]
MVKGSVAAFLALGLSTTAVAPLMVMTQPAMAQLFGQSSEVRIPAGTLITTTLQDAERIVLSPNETLAVTLVTNNEVRSSRGTILIPRGSLIEGELRPTGGGTQFVARTLELRNGRRYTLEATSDVVTRREEVSRGRNTDPIWQGALIGGAASAVLSEIFGSVGIFKVLGGAGAGALAGYLLGGNRRAEVIVVEPEFDLDLRLERDLVL